MEEKQVIDSPHATYYLQLQGSEGRPLFSDAEECQLLHGLLPLIPQATGARLLGYCLLDDCIHLLAESGEAGIVPLGDWLIAEYTQLYNQRQQRHGSVFYPDFLFTLLEPRRYLLPSLHQLHYLPVRSGLVADPGIYPWSSHRDYLSLDSRDWLERDSVMQLLAHQRPNALGRYERFMQTDTQPVVDWINGDHPDYFALASTAYIERLLHSDTPQPQRQTVDLATLTDWVCEQLGLNRADMRLRQSHRHAYQVRALVATLAVTADLASLDAVAEYFAEEPQLLAGAARTLREQRLMYVHQLEQQLAHWLTDVPMATRPITATVDSDTNPAEPAPEPNSQLGTLAEEPQFIAIPSHTH